jgi:hypothetical protein
MGLFALGPILVVSQGPREDYERHTWARIALADAIERDPRYRDVLATWHAQELTAHTAQAAEELEALAREGSPLVEDPVILANGMLGTRVKGRHELDEPVPPPEATIRVGPFVDKLLAGNATLADLGDLLQAADSFEGEAIHLDLRSERPLGTATRHVAVANDAASRARRAIVEAPLREMNRIWGDGEARATEALALITAMRLEPWPFLATDLVRRYAAMLEGRVLGKGMTLDYRFGDPSLGEAAPDDLGIPTFTPTGHAATDLRRIKDWESRVASVKQRLEAAARAGERKHPRTRRMRADEQKGYRRDAGWLFENRANRLSLQSIAERDLGSRDAWRDVQRGVRRARTALTMARDYDPALDPRQTNGGLDVRRD